MSRVLLLFLFAFFVASCGGGSDSSEPAPTPAPTPTPAPQPTNDAPVISVVNVPSSLTENSSVSLSLEFSDADEEDEHSFSWSADNTVVSFGDSTAQNPTINVGDLAFNNGDIQVNLTASVDDGQASDSATVVVTLSPIEELPSISFQSVDEANALEPVVVVADATDTDGNISSYFWSQVSGTEVVFAGQGTNAITFQAPFEFDAQTMQFDLVVEDSEGESNSNSVDLQIAEGQIGYQSSSTNVYDDLGRLIKVTRTIDSRTLTTNYTYDEAGNLLTVTVE